MITNIKNLLIALVVAPIIFTGCGSDDVNELLGTTYTSHVSIAGGTMQIDADSMTITSNYMAHSDDDLSSGYGNHLILTDTTGNLEIELSVDCSEITSFEYTDGNGNILNVLDTDFAYECTEGTTVNDVDEDLPTGAGDITMYTRNWDINISGGITNSDNDTATINADLTNIQIVEVYYKYDLF